MKYKNKFEKQLNGEHQLSEDLRERYATSEDLREGMQLKKVQQLPAEIVNFRNLPDEAHIRLPAMKILFGCSGSTIWRGVKAKRIPEPRHLAERITCWQVGEVRAALAKND